MTFDSMKSVPNRSEERDCVCTWKEPGRGERGREEWAGNGMPNYLRKINLTCTSWFKPHDQAEYPSFTYGAMRICLAVSPAVR